MFQYKNFFNIERNLNLLSEIAIMIQQEIVKADLQIKAFLQDIRDCDGPTETLQVLNSKIAENLKVMKFAIEELEAIASEASKEVEKTNLLREFKIYQQMYASNQLSLRKANMACQNLIKIKSKEELLATTALKQRKRVRADKEGLAKQSSSITDSLVSLNQMMAVQVKQSEESLHTLVNSSATVLETKEEFNFMGNTIHQSKTLLRKYSRRELTDRVLIVLAAVFFFSCIVYVLQKRLL